MEKHAAVAQGRTHCGCGALAEFNFNGEPMCKGCTEVARQGAKEASLPERLKTLCEQQVGG
jgi:hypothetical protein